MSELGVTTVLSHQDLLLLICFSRNLILMLLKNFNLMDFSIQCLLKLQESMSHLCLFLVCMCTKRTHIISFQVSKILNILITYFSETAQPIIFIFIFIVCFVCYINLSTVYKSEYTINTCFRLTCMQQNNLSLLWHWSLKVCMVFLLNDCIMVICIHLSMFHHQHYQWALIKFGFESLLRLLRNVSFYFLSVCCSESGCNAWQVEPVRLTGCISSMLQ